MATQVKTNDSSGVEWLSPIQFAKELQIPLKTIYGWRAAHKGPRGHKIGNHVRYSRADINAWLETTADEHR